MCTEELKFWQKKMRRYEHRDGKLLFEDVKMRENKKIFQGNWEKFMELIGYARNQKSNSSSKHQLTDNINRIQTRHRTKMDSVEKESVNSRKRKLVSSSSTEKSRRRVSSCSQPS